MRLKLEAKLGELIKQEQEAGRLAIRGIDKQDKIKGNTVVTLKDYGLSKMDSSRAQKIAEHRDLIPVDKHSLPLGKGKAYIKLLKSPRSGLKIDSRAYMTP